MQLIKTHPDGGYVAAETGTAMTGADLAELVRKGESFKVVETAAERDVTAQVLAEVFVKEDLATKQAFIKRYLVTPLGREGVKVEGVAKHLLLAAIGGAEAVIEGFERLVQKGDAADRGYAKALKDGFRKLEGAPRELQTKLETLVAPSSAPSVVELQAKVDALGDSLKQFNGKGPERPTKKVASA